MQPRTLGVHHIGLTVPSLDRTHRFFVDHLGFTVVGHRPEYPAVFVSDGTVLVTLWQATDPETARPFDRKRCIGLHHVALRVDDGRTLDALHDQLAGAAGVEVEFAPEPLGDSGLRHMMCAIPGGIRLELVAAGKAAAND